MLDLQSNVLVRVQEEKIFIKILKRSAYVAAVTFEFENPSRCKTGPSNVLVRGPQCYYTTVRGPGILRTNLIV